MWPARATVASAFHVTLASALIHTTAPWQQEPSRVQVVIIDINKSRPLAGMFFPWSLRYQFNVTNADEYEIGLTIAGSSRIQKYTQLYWSAGNFMRKHFHISAIFDHGFSSRASSLNVFMSMFTPYSRHCNKCIDPHHCAMAASAIVCAIRDQLKITDTNFIAIWSEWDIWLEYLICVCAEKQQVETGLKEQQESLSLLRRRWLYREAHLL